MTHKTPIEGFLFSTKVVLVFVDGVGKRTWRSKVLHFAGEAVELVVILISYGSEAAVVGELPKKFCHPDSWVSPLWLTVSLFPRNVSVMGGHGCVIIIQLHLNKCTWLCKECYRPILLYPTGMWWGLKIVKCFELLGKKRHYMNATDSHLFIQHLVPHQRCYDTGNQTRSAVHVLDYSQT